VRLTAATVPDDRSRPADGVALSPYREERGRKAPDGTAQGVDLPVDTVIACCRSLADNGNRLLSPCEVQIATIT
jgi:hypothetical protein